MSRRAAKGPGSPGDDSARTPRAHLSGWLGLALAAALVVAGCGTDTGPPIDPESVTPPPQPTVTPYDPRFAFKQPLPDDAAIDPRSDAIVGQLVENATRERMQLAPLADVPTVYTAKPTDPLYSVDITGVETEFRVPGGARPGEGSDYPMVILDPNHPQLGSSVELRLFQAEIDHTNERINATGAGLFRYNNDGKRFDGNSPSDSLPFAGQGTGSGLSILAGLIRPEEVERGAIHHALRMTYSAADFLPGFRRPAAKTDQPLDTETRDPGTAMQMGMRLQLDPGVNCDTRTVPNASNSSPETRFLRMICHAMQDYGVIVADGTRTEGLVIQMEHDATANWAPIVGDRRFESYGHLIRPEGSLDDGLDRESSSGIPWTKLRVLATSEFDTLGPVGRTK